MGASWPRITWGLVFLLAVVAASADDIITNGNFTAGKVHWQGDGDVTPDGGSLFIVLKRDRWSVVSQMIPARSGSLELKVTFSLSNFCSLTHRRSADEPGPPLTARELNEATGLSGSFRDLALEGTAGWMVVLLGNGQVLRETPVGLSPGEPDSRTFTTTFPADARRPGNEALCFAFPPGKGMVTISNVQLLLP